MSRPHASSDHSSGDKQWRCALPTCNTLLAYINADGTEIRLKHRDLFGWFGFCGYARISCRKCGNLNYIEDPDHPAVKAKNDAAAARGEPAPQMGQTV